VSLNLPFKNAKKDPVIDDEELSFVSSASDAILYQTPRGGQQLLWGIMIFVVVIITWAALAEIDEFTRGEGRVIPSQYIQIVQNLEGGIVNEVFVREGQSVQRDQPLVRLDDCLLYTSDAADDLTRVELVCRRPSQKKQQEKIKSAAESTRGTHTSYIG